MCKNNNCCRHRGALMTLLIILGLFLVMVSETDAAPYQQTITLSSVAPVGKMDISGVKGRIGAMVPIPERWNVSRAVLHFRYENSNILAANSQLVVTLDDTPVLQRTLFFDKPQGNASVDLPGEALTSGYHRLEFRVAQHVKDKVCEDPGAPELWTSLSLGNATLEMEYDLLPVSRSLASLGKFLFDPKIPGRLQVNLVLQDLSEEVIKAAALAAAGVALRFDYRPVEFSVSSQVREGMDNVIIGGDKFIASITEEDSAVPTGPYLGIDHLPIRVAKDGKEIIIRDPQWALVIIGGTNPAEMVSAASTFSFMNAPLPDRQIAEIGKLLLPEFQYPQGRKILTSGGRYPLSMLGFKSRTFKGMRSETVNLDLRLPADAHLLPNAYATIYFDLAYGSTMRKDSVFKVYLNGQFVYSIPVGDDTSGIYQGYQVNLPMYLFKPGLNKLSFIPVLTPLVTGDCVFIQEDNLRLTLFDTSSLVLPEMDSWGELPNLELLWEDGFPLARDPLFADTAMVLTGKEPGIVTAALNLLAQLSQVKGTPPIEISISYDLPKDKDKELLIISPWDKLPQEIASASPLARSVPYVMTGFYDRPPRITWFESLRLWWFGGKSAFPENSGEKIARVEFLPEKMPERFSLMEFQSPFAMKRSVLLAAAGNDNRLLSGALALWDQAIRGKCAGAVVLIDQQNSGEPDVWTQQTGDSYFVGSIRGGSFIPGWIQARPWLSMGILLGLLFVFAVLAYVILKRIAASRVQNE